MKPKRHVAGLIASLLGCALAGMVVVGSAFAHEGEYAHFNYCPSTTASVWKCIQSTTTSGQVVLGKKTVPIVNPVVLQGGFSEPPEEGEPEEGVSKFFGATNGVTLSPTPQPVPGGLSGLVNCKEIGNWLERIACEGVFENGLTGVNATLELARPASEIRISQSHIISETGVALKLPVKVHLENPLLGSSCFVGSSSSPIIWNLTAGETAPPAPNKPIRGSAGVSEYIDGGYILRLKENKLVDNAWSAPAASGCGGPIVEYILDPIIDSSVGVPAAAGHNTAILNNDIYLATAHRVNEK